MLEEVLEPIAPSLEPRQWERWVKEEGYRWENGLRKATEMTFIRHGCLSDSEHIGLPLFFPVV